MGEIDGEGDGSGPGARNRVSVMFSVRCMVRKGLKLALGSNSDVRAVVRLNIRFMVNCG